MSDGARLSEAEIRLMHICYLSDRIKPRFWTTERDICKHLRNEHIMKDGLWSYTFELTGYGKDLLRSYLKLEETPEDKILRYISTGYR